MKNNIMLSLSAITFAFVIQSLPLKQRLGKNTKFVEIPRITTYIVKGKGVIGPKLEKPPRPKSARPSRKSRLGEA